VELEPFTFPRRLGPYVLVRPLGGGGMGNVFLALQGRSGLEKLCVVKRLLPESAGDSERVARFRREAAIARRLSHGAIAQTLAVDEVAGEPFIVQEFLEGRTVTQVLSAAQGAGLRMPVHLSVHIAREIARALAYAHRVEGGGVIHRDVSPHNIMLTFSGEVRLIDFGIARAPTDPSLTQDGLVVGKQSYIAPELLQGELADRRADTYSLVSSCGSCSRSDRLWLSKTPPAPSSVAGLEDVSPGLDAVALKALAARPEDRFQTGEELQQALGPFLPPGFVGETEVSEFIARCYDVETERLHLGEAVREGKALLEESPEPEPSAPRRSRNRSLMPLVIAGALVVALATGVASRVLHRPAVAASGTGDLPPAPAGTGNVAHAPAAAAPAVVPAVPPAVPSKLARVQRRDRSYRWPMVSSAARATPPARRAHTAEGRHLIPPFNIRSLIKWQAGSLSGSCKNIRNLSFNASLPQWR